MTEHLKLTVSDHAGDEVEIAARFEVFSECHGRVWHQHNTLTLAKREIAAERRMEQRMGC